MSSNTLTTQPPPQSCLIRAALYGATPAYLASKSTWSLMDRDIQAILAIYTPTLVILGAGALEGTIRGISHLILSTMKNPSAKLWHLQAANIEFDTAQRLARGAILPISGYVLVASEIAKFIDNRSNTNSRSLINDYFVFYTPYQLSQKSYAHVIKPICKQTWKTTWKVTTKTVKYTVEILDTVGFWKGVNIATTWSAKVINAGLGLAKNLLGTRRNEHDQ